MRRFAEEYAVTFNATASAIEAGYSPKTAYSAGARLLKNVEVQAFLAEAATRRMAKLEVTADRLIAEAGHVATSDIRELFEGSRVKLPSEWSDRFAAAVSSVALLPGGRMRVWLWDKNAAQALLAKLKGLAAPDRIEASITVEQAADPMDAMSDAKLARLIVLLKASAHGVALSVAEMAELARLRDESKHGPRPQRAAAPPLQLVAGRHAKSKAESA